ncbi:MAG: hypothetical protein EOP49_29885, partial [Sphingobacteriales bacterium]
MTPFYQKLVLLFAILLLSQTVSAQLTGSKYIPVDYPTIQAAVTALNAAGVGAGGVVFNVAAGYTETVSSTISLTATGTAANMIVFRKDPATIGANPLIYSYTTGVATPFSAVQDGIWRLVGADYVTIDGIDLSENAANTSNPATMEYGYALYKASTSNGCRNVVIQNCVITLNRNNDTTATVPASDGSTGILVANALSTSAASSFTPIAGGQNSFNGFYRNTIQNCNTGIALIGYSAPAPYTLADTANDVGGNSALTGNTIINYGGGTAPAGPAAAIRTYGQQGVNIAWNTINSNNGSGIKHEGILRGIHMATASGANASILNNTITLHGGGTTQTIYAIDNTAGSTQNGNTILISGNNIQNSTYTTATSGGFYGINSSGSPTNFHAFNNNITGNSTSAVTGIFYGIYN